MSIFRFRLSAIKQWPDIFKNLFSNYFLVVTTALILAGLWIYQIEAGDKLSFFASHNVSRILFSLGLCIPAFLALHVLVNKQNQKILYFTLGLGTIILMLGIYYVNYELRADKQFYRTLALFLAFHGLLSLSAYRKYSSVRDFWQFNTNLLLRTIGSLFFTLVLYLGVIAAIAALNNLFGVHISYNLYFDLMIVALVVYNTFFVLAGMKTSFDESGSEFQYPLSLKVFTQFVLIPLMALYAIILYAFSIKIIVLWSLPKGWIAYLVLLFSIAGILGFLLIYPIRNSTEKKWVRIYSKTFFIALVPLILLLHVSIWTRIGQYGFTIHRYVVAILAIWLTLITGYFLLSKKDNIIVIPASLTALFLLACFGPWGFDAISQKSQQNRIEKIMHDAQIQDYYKKGKINEYKANDKVTTELNSIIDYLLLNHGARSMKGFDIASWDKIADSIIDRQQKFFEEPKMEKGDTAISNSINASSFYSSPNSYTFLKEINVPQSGGYNMARFDYSYSPLQNQIEIISYSRLVPFDLNISFKDQNNIITLDTSGFKLNINGKRITADAEKTVIDALNKCGTACFNAQSPIIVTGKQMDIEYRIIINSLSGKIISDQKYEFENAMGYLLFNQ